MKELFDKLYQRRMLIRLIGVRFSKLVPGSQQIDLFEDSVEMISLYQAMDRIRLKYGRKIIRRGVAFANGEGEDRGSRMEVGDQKS